MKTRNIKITNIFLALVFSIFLFFVFFAGSVNAATFYFSPSNGNFTVGDILTANVLINTEGVPINNADAVINFPTGLLDVVSVNRSQSIFSLWVEEPSFSNSAGTISFNGGLPTPGYTGATGKVITIVFRVRNSGVASLEFSSGAVRANDGYGTDILQTKSQAQYNLITEDKPVQEPPPSVLGVPQAPLVTSLTHPDSDGWYPRNTATFNWPLNDGITSARLLVGKLRVAQPSVVYSPPINTKTIEDFADGVWYFHAQLRNDSGWGGITHFKFQVDTKGPERFDIRLEDRDDPADPKVRMTFDAHDETSGIDHYEIKVGGIDTVWTDDGSSVFETPPLEPGTYTLVAKAIDRAGNFLTDSVEFTISPLPTPTITSYPKELPSGEPLIVQGVTVPDSEVTIWLQKDNETPTKHIVRSDATNNFVFITEEGLRTGTYQLWLKVTDDRGANSNPTEKVSIIVTKTAFLEIGRFAIGVLSVFIPLLALLLLLIFMIWYFWYKTRQVKKKIRKEINEAQRYLHKAFDLLREDMRDQIKLLERAKSRRQLTEEEEKIVRRLRKDLDDAERFIRKEIKDIKEEVNKSY